MTNDELTVDWLQRMAQEAGLLLAEEDAVEVLKGVLHNREMAASLRRILNDGAEPAPVFSPLPGEAKR